MKTGKTILLMLTLLGIYSCNHVKKTSESEETITPQKMQFTKYKNLKLGFTTQNFIEAVPVSLENAKMFVDYAVEKGFLWIELRDPNADLTLEECKEIAQYATNNGIEIGYAIQKGLLDEDYWATLEKGLTNAQVFSGPKTFRTLACGNEFIEDTTKLGWNTEEFEHVVANANKAADIAEKQGLQLVLENGNEAFYGDGETYFGLVDLFAKANKNVGWQFDTANPFSGSRVSPSPEKANEFLLSESGNLFYIHLKSSINKQPQPYLTENPLGFDAIFKTMAENDVPFVAIELLAVGDKAAVFENQEKSIQYLVDNGFIQVGKKQN